MDKMFQKIKDMSFKDRIIIALNVALIVIGVIVFQENRGYESFIVFGALLFSWVSLWLLSGYAKERGLKIDFVSKLAITLLIVFAYGGYLFLGITAEVASVNNMDILVESQTLVAFFLGALITSFYLVFFKKLVGRFRKEK